MTVIPNGHRSTTVTATVCYRFCTPTFPVYPSVWLSIKCINLYVGKGKGAQLKNAVKRRTRSLPHRCAINVARRTGIKKQLSLDLTAAPPEFHCSTTGVASWDTQQWEVSTPARNEIRSRSRLSEICVHHPSQMDVMSQSLARSEHYDADHSRIYFILSEITLMQYCTHAVSHSSN